MSSPEELERKLERIGALTVTYRYPTPTAAKTAWERAERRASGISVWRHASPRDMNDQYVTAFGEPGEHEHEMRKMEQLLKRGGVKAEVPAFALEIFRARRRKLLIETAQAGASYMRNRIRYGEQGAFALKGGGTVPRRRQG